MTAPPLSPNSRPWPTRLYLPMYSVADAARYAETRSQRVAYWHYHGGNDTPTLPGKAPKTPLSYLELIEVAVVATLRKAGLSLRDIRQVRSYAASELNSQYPFAEYQFQTDGVNVF